MSRLRHPDAGNVHEIYGERAQAVAQFWVEAGELLGYRLCSGTMQRMPPEPHVDSERVFVEVSRGEDHLLWYTKSMETIADLLEQVRDAFGEAPHETMVLVRVGQENCGAMPRDTQLQNLMQLCVMYSALPALNTVLQLESLEQELSQATQQLTRAQNAYQAWQLDPTADGELARYHVMRVYDCNCDVQVLVRQVRTVREQLR